MNQVCVTDFVNCSHNVGNYFICLHTHPSAVGSMKSNISMKDLSVPLWNSSSGYRGLWG